MTNLRNFFSNQIERLKAWSEKNLLGLFAFNIILMLLVLLHSAGYFNPYLPLTINFIVFLSIIMLALLLHTGSKIIFSVALALWIFAAFLRIVGVEVWAERTSVYVYQSLIIGFVLFIIETRVRKH